MKACKQAFLFKTRDKTSKMLVGYTLYVPYMSYSYFPYVTPCLKCY